MRLRFRHCGTVFVAALFLFILALSLFVGLFKWRDGTKVSLDYIYYFLVRDCETTTAGAVAGESYLAGGAGYLLDPGNAVVLACYYNEADVTAVAHTMSANGVQIRILERKFTPFRLPDGAASERSRIEGNAQTVDSAAHLLYDLANGLERGDMTQEAARVGLQGAASSLEGLAAENKADLYALWNASLLQYARRLRELSESLLFPKDLRYCQVGMVFCILQLHTYFL